MALARAEGQLSAAHMTLRTGAARAIVVGDVHGCCAELGSLLKACEFSPAAGDVVLLVGDLVNKGPSSAEVVRLAVDSGFHAVMGNHDLIGLSRWDEWRRTGIVPAPDQHGSYEWVATLRPEDVQWLRGLPWTITLPELGAIVVHAGLVPGTPLVEQTPETMHSIRNLLVDLSTEGLARRYEPLPTVEHGEAWGQFWDGYLSGHESLFLLFGHDAPRGLQQFEYAWGLDTNCCNGGQLTACILPSRQLISVPALGSLHKTGEGAAREWRPH